MRDPGRVKSHSRSIIKRLYRAPRPPSMADNQLGHKRILSCRNTFWIYERACPNLLFRLKIVYSPIWKTARRPRFSFQNGSEGVDGDGFAAGRRPLRRHPLQSPWGSKPSGWHHLRVPSFLTRNRVPNHQENVLSARYVPCHFTCHLAPCQKHLLFTFKRVLLGGSQGPSSPVAPYLHRITTSILTNGSGAPAYPLLPFPHLTALRQIHSKSRMMMMMNPTGLDVESGLMTSSPVNITHSLTWSITVNSWPCCFGRFQLLLIVEGGLYTRVHESRGGEGGGKVTQH